MNTEISNERVSQLNGDIEAMRKAMASLSARRKALMPALSNDELAVVIDVTKAIDVSQELATVVSELRKDRQFSDEQKDQVAAAKLEHVRSINTTEVKAQISECVGRAYLKTFKLKHRADGRIGVQVSGQI